MARLLGVSRSGFYDWAHRRAAGPSPAQQRRSDLTAKIITHHADSDQVYGSPRILADLREAGEQVSAKTVAKLMRQAGIAGISPRGFVPVTTQAGPDPQPVGDLVGRRFDHGQLNRVWTSDITYLATGRGLAVPVRHPRRLLPPRRRLGDRGPPPHRPGRGRPPAGRHAARRAARESHLPRRPRHPIHLAADRRRLPDLPVLRSMGRTGVCWDNAAAESFWSTLKTEFYNRRHWPTKAEARLAVGAWIEERYNRLRRHSSIGMISPVRFEELHTQTAEAA